MDDPNWLTRFRGGQLGLANYEILTIQHIPRKELRDEQDLMSRKWFDYRRLHPMQATYYFVKCYTDAYRELWRKAIDCEVAPYVRAIKELDFLMARERFSFWRLRRLCDSFGMPYDFFMNFAMSYQHRMVTNGGKVVPPRPAHIQNNENLVADAVIAWQEWCDTTLQVATDPYYRVENFRGDQNQLDHERFVVDQVKRRQHPKFALCAALYTHDAIRIEEALRQFGSQIVTEAVGNYSDLA